MTLPQRFMDKVMPEPNSGCWLWTACWATNGYGRYGIRRGRHVPAHRFAYEAEHGEVPPGLELDHKCRVRCCVNPDHVEPVTHAENMRRAREMAPWTRPDMKRSHCPRGHPYDAENAEHRPGYRIRCRECHRTQERERYANRKRAV